MIFATEFVCTMMGGSASALFKCSDNRYYVVKDQDSRSCDGLLSTRFLAGKLARWVGLPVPEVEIIQVDQWLIDHSPELSRITAKPWMPDRSAEMNGHVPTIRPKRSGGLQLGSRYLAETAQGRIFDYFPEKMLSKVRNLNTFAGILVFDLWTNKLGTRKAVFWRAGLETHYTVAFIDLEERLLPTQFRDWDCAFDPTKVSLYAHKAVYQHITEWNDFEPFLSRVEAIDMATIEGLAAQVPKYWHGMHALLRRLQERKTTVRGLLLECLTANPEIFPNWGNEKPASGRKHARRCSDLDTGAASRALC